MKKIKSNIGWQIDRSPYSREYFKNRYNKSRNTISSWCTGKSYPSIEILWDLADVLGVSVDELYTRLEEE
ncbi:helix-turn-helix domain-containing protein [Bacillus infantis]|uniref:helix-turn-helix domain-containing protein n=1 Tax=Bacillus infantis TaxID=324767 RepID=UPI003CF96B78